MSVENALEVSVGDSVTAVFSTLSPHRITEGKAYQVKEVTPLYRCSPPEYISQDPNAGPLCNADFKIVDDSGSEIDVSYTNFSW